MRATINVKTGEERISESVGSYAPGPEQARTAAEANRQAAYTQEADPLFFKWQAGEATKEEWEAKREEIRQRFPYPEGTDNE